MSGETGCDDPRLRDNAIRFEMTAPGERTPRSLYLFVFRDRAGYERAAMPVEACRRTFAARASRPVDAVAVSPYRLFGEGLTSDVRALLESALAEAAAPRVPVPGDDEQP